MGLEAGYKLHFCPVRGKKQACNLSIVASYNDRNKMLTKNNQLLLIQIRTFF